MSILQSYLFQPSSTSNDGFTPEERTALLAAATRINAVPGNGPVAPVPEVEESIEGLVTVFLDTRQQGEPFDTDVSIYVRDYDKPRELLTWNEVVGEAIVFKKLNPDDPYARVRLFDTEHMPPHQSEEAAYYAAGKSVALDQQQGQFNVPPLTDGKTTYFLSELLKMWREGHPE